MQITRHNLLQLCPFVYLLSFFSLTWPRWPHQIFANLQHHCDFPISFGPKACDYTWQLLCIDLSDIHNFLNYRSTLLSFPSYQLPHPCPPSLKRKSSPCKALSWCYFQGIVCPLWQIAGRNYFPSLVHIARQSTCHASLVVSLL